MSGLRQGGGWEQCADLCFIVAGSGEGGPFEGPGRPFFPVNPRANFQQCPGLSGGVVRGRVRAQIVFLFLFEVIGLWGGSGDRAALFLCGAMQEVRRVAGAEGTGGQEGPAVP